MPAKILRFLLGLYESASPVDNLRRTIWYRLTGKSCLPGTQWAREVMNEELVKIINVLGPERLDVLEISPGDFWQRLQFKSFRSVSYPEFDICAMALDTQFDLIIADQVFEHLLWPYRAARNVYRMLKPGGYFIVTTPFLLRIHDHPVDCSRWTELGMKHLLAESGFDLEGIRTGSWGNRSCVRAHLKLHGWTEMSRWRPLHHEPIFPVVVWAVAQRSSATRSALTNRQASPAAASA
jgi:SAM-dependent methyltransferase